MSAKVLSARDASARERWIRQTEFVDCR